MLKIQNLHAYYGKSHVLHGVDFEVRSGEIVALLGRNGSGRSTTAKAIMGLVDCEGTIDWKGQAIRGHKPFEIAHRGTLFMDEIAEMPLGTQARQAANTATASGEVRAAASETAQAASGRAHPPPRVRGGTAAAGAGCRAVAGRFVTESGCCGQTSPPRFRLQPRPPLCATH